MVGKEQNTAGNKVPIEPLPGRHFHPSVPLIPSPPVEGMVSFSTPCSNFRSPLPFPSPLLDLGSRCLPQVDRRNKKTTPHFFCSRFHSHLIIKTPPPLPSARPRRDVGLHFGPVPAPHLQPPVQRRRRPSSDAPGGGAPIATPAFRLFLSRLSESVCRSLSNPRRLWSEILDHSSSSRPESPPMPHPASTRTLPTSASTTSPSSLPPSPSPSLGLLPAAGPPFSASPYSSLISCSHLFHQIGP